MPDDKGNPTFGDRMVEKHFGAGVSEWTGRPYPQSENTGRFVMPGGEPGVPPNATDEEAVALHDIRYANREEGAAAANARAATVGRMIPELVGGIYGAGKAGAIARGLKATGRGVMAGARMVGAAVGGGAGASVSAKLSGEPVAPEALSGALRSAGGEALGLGFDAALRSGAARWVGSKVKDAALEIPGVRRLVMPVPQSSLVEGAEQTLSIVQGGNRGLSPAELAWMQERGIRQRTPTAGQLTNANWVDVAEEVAEAGFLSRGIMRGTREKAAETVQGQLGDYIAQFGGDHPEVAGYMLQEALRNGAAGHQRVVRGIYKGLVKRYGATQVDMAPVANTAKWLDSQLVGLRKSNAAAAKVIDDVLGTESESVLAPFAGRKGRPQKVTREFAARAGEVDFREAISLRSDLLALSRLENDVLPTNTRRVIDTLAKTVDARIQVALGRSHGAEAVRQWRTANAVTSSGHTAFNNEFMRRWVDSAEPSMIVDEVVTAGRPERIRNVRTIVERQIASKKAAPEAWRDVQGVWLQRAMRNSTNPGTRVTDGEKMLKEIQGMGKSWDELMPDPAQRKAVEDYARALYNTQKTAKPGQTLGVALRLIQGGAVLNVLSAPFREDEASGAGGALGSFAIVVAPRALARVLTDPAMVRYLTIGLSVPSTRVASRLASQMTARLDQILEPGEAIRVDQPQEQVPDSLAAARAAARAKQPTPESERARIASQVEAYRSR